MCASGRSCTTRSRTGARRWRGRSRWRRAPPRASASGPVRRSSSSVTRPTSAPSGWPPRSSASSTRGCGVRELAFGKVNLCLFLGPLREDGRHELVTLIESVSLADELEVSVLDGGSDQVICDGRRGREHRHRRSQKAPGSRLGCAARPSRDPQAGPDRRRDGGRLGRRGGDLARRRAPRPPSRRPDRARRPAGFGRAQSAGAGPVARDQRRRGRRATRAARSPRARDRPLVASSVDGRRVRGGRPARAPSLAGRPRRLGCASSSPRSVPARCSAPGLTINDLEPAAVSLCPDVALNLEQLRRAGADHALVCGSGPTVAGLCWGGDAPERAAEIARSCGNGFRPPQTYCPCHLRLPAQWAIER